MTTDLSRQEVNAQAAAWLARLHSDSRTASDVKGFQTWLEEDVAHRDTFETLTALWDASGDVKAKPVVGYLSRRRVLVGAGSVAAAAAVGGVLTFAHAKPEQIETALGEQRKLLLSDGSRLILDAGTHVSVSMGKQRRSIELIQGRANFVVSKDPLRPFVVTAGSREVIAVGTAFDVARQGERMSVTMVEGKVVIRQSGAAKADRTLIAGDRLRTGGASENFVVDRPEIATATAWQVGRAVFDDDRLDDAVAELNRYQPKQIVIRDPSVGALRISGSYKTGDSASFARSVAELLPVRVDDDQQEIIIRRRQAAN